MAAARSPDPRAGSRRVPVLHDAALAGPVGLFVQEAAPFTEADPAALLVSVLVALGVAAGGGAHVDAGNARQTAGLFALVVAETPTANRGLSWAVTRALLDVVDPWVARARVLTGLGNGKAVLDALVSPPPPWAMRIGETGRHPAPGADERLLVFEPAFTRALAVAARPTSPLAWVIRNAWDGHPLDLPARRHRLVVERHHVGIVAHATADQLRSQLSMTGPGASFVSRFLVVLAVRRQHLLDEGNVPVDLLLRHGRAMASALEAVRSVGLLARTPAAAERWAEVYEELALGGEEGLLGLVLARASRQVTRLSVAYALVEGSPVITRANLEAALALWRYGEASSRFVLGADGPSDLATRLLEALAAAGERGLTRSEQVDYFGRNVAARDLASARAELERAGLVVTAPVRRAERGRPAMVSRVVLRSPAERPDGTATGEPESSFRS